jgi:hypothetical protein
MSEGREYNPEAEGAVWAQQFLTAATRVDADGNSDPDFESLGEALKHLKGDQDRKIIAPVLTNLDPQTWAEGAAAFKAAVTTGDAKIIVKAAIGNPAVLRAMLSEGGDKYVDVVLGAISKTLPGSGESGAGLEGTAEISGVATAAAGANLGTEAEATTSADIRGQIEKMQAMPGLKTISRHATELLEALPNLIDMPPKERRHILPYLDDMSNPNIESLMKLSSNQNEALAALSEWVKLSQLMGRELAQHGVAQIYPKNKDEFDPNLHDASADGSEVLTTIKEDQGKVVNVRSWGWQFGEDVPRKALVRRYVHTDHIPEPEVKNNPEHKMYEESEKYADAMALFDKVENILNIADENKRIKRLSDKGESVEAVYLPLVSYNDLIIEGCNDYEANEALRKISDRRNQIVKLLDKYVIIVSPQNGDDPSDIPDMSIEDSRVKTPDPDEDGKIYAGTGTYMQIGGYTYSRPSSRLYVYDSTVTSDEYSKPSTPSAEISQYFILVQQIIAKFAESPDTITFDEANTLASQLLFDISPDLSYLAGELGYQQASREYNNYIQKQIALRNELLRYCEVVVPTVGDKPTEECDVVQRIETRDQELDGTIAAVETIGLKNKSTNNNLLLPQVKIYELAKPKDTDAQVVDIEAREINGKKVFEVDLSDPNVSWELKDPQKGESLILKNIPYGYFETTLRAATIIEGLYFLIHPRYGQGAKINIGGINTRLSIVSGDHKTLAELVTHNVTHAFLEITDIEKGTNITIHVRLNGEGTGQEVAPLTNLG